ncbi:MAG: hypothetical protein ABR941_11955, partial [Thermoleophilia bacterium]
MRALLAVGRGFAGPLFSRDDIRGASRPESGPFGARRGGRRREGDVGQYLEDVGLGGRARRTLHARDEPLSIEGPVGSLVAEEVAGSGHGGDDAVAELADDLAWGGGRAVAHPP